MNRRTMLAVILWVCISVCVPTEAQTEKPFLLHGGERIVFFGDSITQAGLYVEYIDAFLRTRFPDKPFDVINRGISSETLSGTSEIDHHPPRPDAHKRFSRDITPLKPDVLVSCFGMNDGNYHPFSEELFAKYKAGVERLIKRSSEEAKATLVIMTPPPFDPYRSKASDPNAEHWGYKYAFLGYDDVLERYSRWLLTLRDAGFVVADVHAAINKLLTERRKDKVSFYLSGDAVHPNPTGHWLMAQTLLLAWNAPAEAGSIHIDAKTQRVIEGNVSALKVQEGTIELAWRTALPMPMDPRWDAESIALENVADRLNRHRLQVTSLPAGRYRVLADGKAIGEFDHEQLAGGVNLLDYADFPTVERSLQVLALVQQRQRLLYKAWRDSIKAGEKNPPDKVTQEAAQLDIRTRELCRPKEIVLRIIPISG
jgi:lysophospholipase L1-like esterase